MPPPLWSRQPFKAVYMVFFLLKTPPHLTLLFIKYLFSPLRPLAEWDAKTNLASAFWRIILHFLLTTRSQRFINAGPEKAGDRWAPVEPAPEPLLTGILEPSRHPAIKPASVDAIWFPAAPPPDVAEQKVLVHFPGGAYVVALSHDFVGQVAADALAAHLDVARVVWAQYRLSGTAETRFPAALHDALAFYRYLLSLGVRPENIIVSGDSAGGNLALALLRHLQSTSSLPMPGGAAVFSPWVHITAQAGRDLERSRNSSSDMLPPSLLQWGADSFLPEGNVPTDAAPYISPLHHPFQLSTPLFIHAGTAEAFYDDVKSFADEMASVNGRNVRFHATPLAPHDLLLAHKTFGMTQGLDVALQEAREFLDGAK